MDNFFHSWVRATIGAAMEDLHFSPQPPAGKQGNWLATGLDTAQPKPPSTRVGGRVTSRRSIDVSCRSPPCARPRGLRPPDDLVVERSCAGHRHPARLNGRRTSVSVVPSRRCRALSAAPGEQLEGGREAKATLATFFQLLNNNGRFVVPRRLSTKNRFGC